MIRQWLMIRQLDKQLAEWQRISAQYPRPKFGWVKTLRIALNMSIEQFANRLGLSRARINQLESAEINDAVSLRTLREAANALDCELVYAIIPKQGYSLEKIIEERANQIANERIAGVAHSMSLEAQDVNKEVLNYQKNEIAKNLKERLNKKFWQSPENKKNGKKKEIK